MRAKQSQSGVNYCPTARLTVYGRTPQDTVEFNAISWEKTRLKTVKACPGFNIKPQHKNTEAHYCLHFLPGW